jgi:hypothetical protein
MPVRFHTQQSAMRVFVSLLLISIHHSFKLLKYGSNRNQRGLLTLSAKTESRKLNVDLDKKYADFIKDEKAAFPYDRLEELNAMISLGKSCP